MAQHDELLNHLQIRGSITQVEAQAIYKMRSLTRRIADLREQGYNIKSETKTDPTGQRYVRYWLRSKNKSKARANAYFESKVFKFKRAYRTW